MHPTFYFDSDSEAKEAINFISDFFIDLKKPVYTLVETDKLISEIQMIQTPHQLTKVSESSKEPQDQRYYQTPSALNYVSYFPRINETQLVESLNGENNINVSGKNIVIIGGYLLACLRTAFQHLSYHNLENQNELNIYLPLRAVYGKGLSPKDKQVLSKEGFRNSLSKWLKKGIGYEVYRDEKLFIKGGIDEPKTLRIYIRPVKEGLFPLNQF